MYPRSSKNKKHITIFIRKIIIFTAMKKCSIFHGCVIVMRPALGFGADPAVLLTSRKVKAFSCLPTLNVYLRTDTRS